MCGAQFARSFCLTRHINSKIGPNYRCGLCDDRSFPRLDKLGDHLRSFHRLGVKAFNLYRDANSCASSLSLTAAGNQPVPAGDPSQTYPMLPTFGHSTVPNELASASMVAPEVSSAEPCVSSDTFTVSPQASKSARGIRRANPVIIQTTDNWWYPASCEFAAYPSEVVL